MSQFILMTSVESFQEILPISKEKPVLILKHSTACPISAQAYAEVEEFSNEIEQNSMEIRVVHVIEDRPVSNEIASYFGIQHASPQIFIIQNQKVIFHATHFDITKSALLSTYNEMIEKDQHGK
ncbi:bacillithiol system redox-active protein YtxJ [Thermoflavimicrobium daqui]|jgi:bacillithiol system protein YtxJ|uniref:Bacillithiol system redox-active protein YtxJ n=1 Tax=Thermoflavimicrobium daqui TaxID=2137476 RepID=A0A364K624_9BACL|nr:bacillithiol system redox-active protein YtxJ [Thermoflavimicrobium daqui]RAL25640.1 bacillithiol system redox-active protein YtxJ [Thermoflavimicrobium daqui]